MLGKSPKARRSEEWLTHSVPQVVDGGTGLGIRQATTIPWHPRLGYEDFQLIVMNLLESNLPLIHWLSAIPLLYLIFRHHYKVTTRAPTPKGTFAILIIVVHLAMIYPSLGASVALLLTAGLMYK